MHRAALEVRPGLDAETLVLDIAQNVSARLEHDLAAMNGSLDTTVHGNAFGLYAAIDHRLRRNEKKPATHVAFDMAVDLDQAVGRNVAFDLQAFCNYGSSAPEKHDLPLRDIQNAFFCRSALDARHGAACFGFIDPVSAMPACFSLAMLSSNAARSLDN